MAAAASRFEAVAVSAFDPQKFRRSDVNHVNETAVRK
jgi:hypothetical protein